MRNVWKGLVVGGLTGVTAGVVLDILQWPWANRSASMPLTLVGGCRQLPTWRGIGSMMPISPSTFEVSLNTAENARARGRVRASYGF
jgi:hypothetical protein